MTLRAYAVDDERLAVERLTRLLERTGRVEIAGSATDPQAALEFLQSHDVDVIFLDIEMPELTGFELLQKLNRDVPVIFTTAYDRYAIEAFTVNSVDYLLKPVDAERLERAIDKLERLTASGFRAAAGTSIRTLARELAAQLKPGARLERIASRAGERTTILSVGRVTHFFSKDKLTFAVLGGHASVVNYTLDELETRLDPRGFVRIHRSTIVNLAFVKEVHPGADGLMLRLNDDKQTDLGVARDRVRLLKERLGL